MGSESDLPQIQICLDTLKECGIPFEARVMSAHRSPDAVRRFAADAEANDFAGSVRFESDCHPELIE